MGDYASEEPDTSSRRRNFSRLASRRRWEYRRRHYRIRWIIIQDQSYRSECKAQLSSILNKKGRERVPSTSFSLPSRPLPLSSRVFVLLRHSPRRLPGFSSTFEVYLALRLVDVILPRTIFADQSSNHTMEYIIWQWQENILQYQIIISIKKNYDRTWFPIHMVRKKNINNIHILISVEDIVWHKYFCKRNFRTAYQKHRRYWIIWINFIS